MNESEPTKEPLSGYQGLGHTNLQTKRGKKPQQTEEVGAGGARPPIFPPYQEPYPSMDEVPLACNPPPETSSGVQLSTGRPRAVCGRWDPGEGRTTWLSKATASPGTSRLGSAPLPAKAPLLRERRGRDGTGTSMASPLPHAAADCREVARDPHLACPHRNPSDAFNSPRAADEAARWRFSGLFQRGVRSRHVPDEGGEGAWEPGPGPREGVGVDGTAAWGGGPRPVGHLAWLPSLPVTLASF